MPSDRVERSPVRPGEAFGALDALSDREVERLAITLARLLYSAARNLGVLERSGERTCSGKAYGHVSYGPRVVHQGQADPPEHASGVPRRGDA